MNEPYQFDANNPFATLYGLMPNVQVSMDSLLKTLEQPLGGTGITLFSIVQTTATLLLLIGIVTQGLSIVASRNQDAIGQFFVKFLVCVFLISGSSEIARSLRETFYAVHQVGTSLSGNIVNEAIEEASTLSLVGTSAMGLAGAAKMGLTAATRTGVKAAASAGGKAGAQTAVSAQTALVTNAKNNALGAIASLERWMSLVIISLVPLLFAYYATILSSGTLVIIVGLMLPIIGALSIFPSRIASVSIGGSMSLLLGSFIATLFVPAFLGLCLSVGFVARRKI